MALEALAAEGYGEGKLSTGQVRRLLSYNTRMQVHAFLKDHGVFLHYGADDLQHDREAGDRRLASSA
jgi:predicted HTH domain antitoxin